jgi:tRNA/rRNA methyltransferase
MTRVPPPDLPAPLIVLVRPQMGENIGAAARAMLNFGLSGLRLVAPRDGWPNPKATAMASGAAPVLDQVRVFDSVAEAVADCHFVAATTARQRGLFIPVLTPEEALRRTHAEIAAGRRTAILFGAEKTGLETDELALADAILTIPVNPDFSSLNLAQAVGVVAYEWGRASALPQNFASPYVETPADRGTVEGMVQHLFATLRETGYFYPPDKRPTLERNIRTLFVNAGLTEAEVRLFRGIIRQLDRAIAGEPGTSRDTPTDKLDTGAGPGRE